MKKPKASYVLPAWQSEPWIRDTLESIRKQTIRPLELIAIDDGSTDDTWEILLWFGSTYASEGFQIKVHRNDQRLGAAACRNFGNKQAKADIIFVTDAGDNNHRGRTVTTLEYMRKHPEIGVVSTAVVEVDPLGKVIGKQYPLRFSAKPGQKPGISHPTVAYRKEIATAYPYREGNVDTDQYEAMLLTAGRAGVRFGEIPKFFVKTRWLPHSTHGRDMVKARKQKREIYEEFGIELPDFLRPEKDAAYTKELQEVGV